MLLPGPERVIAFRPGSVSDSGPTTGGNQGDPGGRAGGMLANPGSPDLAGRSLDPLREDPGRPGSE
jgi:hypothetical protein